MIFHVLKSAYESTDGSKPRPGSGFAQARSLFRNRARNFEKDSCLTFYLGKFFAKSIFVCKFKKFNKNFLNFLKSHGCLLCFEQKFLILANRFNRAHNISNNRLKKVEIQCFTFFVPFVFCRVVSFHDESIKWFFQNDSHLR